MKHVAKARVPHDYMEWRNQVQGTQDENYQIGLKNPLKRELHEALISEQG